MLLCDGVSRCGVIPSRVPTLFPDKAPGRPECLGLWGPSTLEYGNETGQLFHTMESTNQHRSQECIPEIDKERKRNPIRK